MSSCPAASSIALLLTKEAEVIVLEPAGVLNTGNVIDETFTAPMCARI